MAEELDNGQLVRPHRYCIANEVGKERQCNSSDALALYEHKLESGEIVYDAFCYSCNQRFSVEEVHKSSLAKDLGIEGGKVVEYKNFTKVPKNNPLSKQEVIDFIKQTGYSDKPYRGMLPEYLKFFGHLAKKDKEGKTIAFYYPETQEGAGVTGYKCRNLPKDFRYGKLGVTGLSCQLAGQVKFPKGGKYVLITAGEIDLVSAYQMLREDQKSRGQGEYDPVAVVSPTTGEPSAYKQVAAQYEFFDSFDIIVVGMDNDEVGKISAQAIAKVLPADKVRIATWSSKDPNKMLEEGKQKQFVRDFYNAKPYVNIGIKSASEAMSEVAEFLNAPKIKLPKHLHRLEENMRGGIKSTGAIVNIIGHTSIGKSLFTDTLIYDWVFSSPIVPTILSLERTAGELLIDLYSLHLKKNLTWFKDGNDALEYLGKPEVKVLCENLVYKEDGTPRFFIVDERSASVESMQKQIDKSRKQNSSNFIICDPLTDFLRSLPLEDQENFMLYQKMLKKDGVVFINVLHTRKPQSDKEGKPKDVTEYDVLGSGSFVQSADINIILNRDKMAEDPRERNTTYVSMPKCRGGITGLACKVYYDPETRQVYDYDDRFGTNTNNSTVLTDEEGEPVVIF